MSLRYYKIMSKPVSRQAIRQQIRQARRSLSAQAQIDASLAVVEQIKQSDLIKKNQKVALYLANDGELNPFALIEYAWQMGADVYLPVLHPFAKNHLAFFQYHANTQLTKNKFGIAEPKLNCLTICPIKALDYIFMPLVAFDAQGNRMGMGGGFYDRTLAPNLNESAGLNVHNHQQKRIGLAHSCQQVAQLPVEAWDVPLDYIVTPENMLTPLSTLPR